MEDATKALVDARSQAIDTLGNLTLITRSLNPSLGNAGWAKKKEKLAGSLLILNREVANVDNWNEKSIEDRAEIIANVIASRWATPISDD